MSLEQEEGGSSGGTPLEMVAAGVVTVLTLTVAFGLLAVGYPLFWVAFPIGFGGGMPLAIGLARWYGSRQEHAREDERPGRDRDEEALSRLRERYARGELTETESSDGSADCSRRSPSPTRGSSSTGVGPTHTPARRPARKPTSPSRPEQRPARLCDPRGPNS